jgi:hypothetical protein
VGLRKYMNALMISGIAHKSRQEQAAILGGVGCVVIWCATVEDKLRTPQAQPPFMRSLSAH